MALTKTYTIEIQLDNAQQQLAETQKQLNELDKKLEGLDRDSPVAKAIVAEMAKVAKEVEGLTSQTDTFARKLDSLKPGSIGALKEEAKTLEASLDGLVHGSEEYEAALGKIAELKKKINAEPPAEVFKQGTLGSLKQDAEELEQKLEGLEIGTTEWKKAMLELGRTKGAIKEIDDAVDALDPKIQAAAFLDLTNGLVGGFGIATVAAENFGLASEGSAEEVEKKMLQLITVMQSFEAIQKAVNSETRASLRNVLDLAKTNIKSIFTMGEGWTLAGIKARLFGTTTRAALTATGIGALIVAVGLLISNWDWVTKQVGKLGEMFKSTFPAIGKAIDAVIGKARDLASIITFGLIDNEATAAIAKETERKKTEIEKQIALRKNLIAEEAAAGRATYKLKQDQLRDEKQLLESQLTQLEKNSKEYLEKKQEIEDKASEIRQLKFAHDKSLADRDVKAAEEAEKKRKAAADKRKEQSAKEEEDAYNAMRKAEADEYTARAEARNVRYELAKAAGAREQVLLQIQVDNYTEQQQDLLDQGKYHGEEWWKLENQKLENLKAINAADKAETEKTEADKKVLQDKELLRLQEFNDIAVINLKQRNASEKEINQELLKGINERLAYMKQEGLETSKAFAELLLEKAEMEKAMTPEKSMMDKFLQSVFHIKDEDLEKVKQSLNESMATIYSSLTQITESLVSDSLLKLDAYTQYLDEELEMAQERQQAADEALNESLKRRQDLESQLESARGSKREYLIQKIAKERQEEARLTAEKKKAAAEEAKIAKEKEEAEKKRQELEAKGQVLAAATATADSIATAASAVRAGVSAVAGANTLPFPANLVAMVAALASVGAAIASAKKLGQTVQAAKMADGGPLYGPSHDAGGIRGTGKFSHIEVEGGEYVLNKHAYKNNRETIERINQIGRSVRFVAVPEHQVRYRMADGGQLPGSSASGANAIVTGDTAPLANEELSAIRRVLERIEQHAAVTADKEPGYIGPWESREIVKQAASLDDDEKAGQLF